jgi:hypothetical protein
MDGDEEMEEAEEDPAAEQSTGYGDAANEGPQEPPPPQKDDEIVDVSDEDDKSSSHSLEDTESECSPATTPVVRKVSCRREPSGDLPMLVRLFHFLAPLLMKI